MLTHLAAEQLRQLTEERTTSKEAIASLENANKLLEGSFILHQCIQQS